MEKIGTDPQGRFAIYYDSFNYEFTIINRKKEKTKIKFVTDGSKVIQDENYMIVIPNPKNSLEKVQVIPSGKNKSDKTSFEYGLKQIHEIFKDNFIFDYPHFNFIFEGILKYCETKDDEKAAFEMLKSYLHIYISKELQSQFEIDKIIERIEI